MPHGPPLLPVTPAVGQVQARPGSRTLSALGLSGGCGSLAFFFFFSSLLRYNSYTRQFTHFKGATPRLLVYSRVRSHHHAHFKTPSSPREETLHLLRLPPQPSATTRLLPSSGLPVSGATEVAVLSEQLRPWSPGGLPFWRILFRGLDTHVGLLIRLSVAFGWRLGGFRALRSSRRPLL